MDRLYSKEQTKNSLNFLQSHIYNNLIIITKNKNWSKAHSKIRATTRYIDFKASKTYGM